MGLEKYSVSTNVILDNSDTYFSFTVNQPKTDSEIKMMVFQL